MKQHLFLLVLCAALLLVQGRPENPDSQDVKSKPKSARAVCGYESCPVTSAGVTNVHLVAHTHDDVGWLKTFDQYFYGSNTGIQRAGVQYILDSVIDSLLADAARKFVYVETSFFWKWWEEQSEARRDEVKMLVAEGQLHFAGGAWSMNDEATTHYQSTVDQFTWGLRKLNDTFGDCGRPRAGWQIDPFGHSREMANLFAALGYDGLLFGRLDYQDKNRRRETKEMEMLWRGSDDLGTASDLFTVVMYNGYSPPPGFCFNVLCNDDPINDDPTSPDYNVDSRVSSFLNYVDEMTRAYKSNNLIMTMGMDFNYQNANMWYKNMDKLIKYTNERAPTVNVVYSTPDCYIKAVHDANIELPTKEDDFFPYASNPNAFWTGYFTSRPTIKYFERISNNFLQVCKQLDTLSNNRIGSDIVDLDELRSAMGVMQHHDAITGTEKQHVARDYARLLDKGVQDCLAASTDALNDIMSASAKKMNKAVPYLDTTLCQLNITQCAASENSNNFVVTLYNPLGHAVDHYARIPVAGSGYIIRDPRGNTVTSEIVPIASETFSQLTDRVSVATGELIFLASSLPPLGYRSYYVSTAAAASPKPAADDDDTIQNENLKLTVDPDTGLISSVFIVEYNLTIPLIQELLYYEGEVGNNAENKNRSSGAYIFRPKPGLPKIFTAKPENRLVKGNSFEEVHQKFSDWATQVVRLYKGENHVEFEWLVGPINIGDLNGKEIISRFSSNLKSAGTFYTDLNGRQLLKRVVNFRPTWEVTLEEPVSGNYYPLTTAIVIRDQDSGLELSVLTDRAQGGTSLADGQVELMVHRRLLNDDSYGVGEALNESIDGKPLVARGRHFLHFGRSDDKGAVTRRQLILAKQLEPTSFISSADGFDISQWQEATNEFSGLTTALPENLHLLTLEPWKDDTLLIRLEHFLQETDDPQGLSAPATVNLENLFTGIQVLSVSETTLGANQFLSDSNRFVWQSTRASGDAVVEATGARADEDLDVTLEPMQIRTFIANVKFLN